MQRMRWLDSITDSKDMNLNKPWERDILDWVLEKPAVQKHNSTDRKEKERKKKNTPRKAGYLSKGSRKG